MLLLNVPRGCGHHRTHHRAEPLGTQARRGRTEMQLDESAGAIDRRPDRVVGILRMPGEAAQRLGVGLEPRQMGTGTGKHLGRRHRDAA